MRYHLASLIGLTLGFNVWCMTPDLSKLPQVAGDGLPLTPPAVNEVQVIELFGHDLSTLPTPTENYMLAIAMDKVTENSISEFLPVGVPYLTFTGDGYWFSAFADEPNDLSVLINLSILLSVSHKPYFAHNSEINLDKVLITVLKRLSLLGYWPADYLLSEHQHIVDANIGHEAHLYKCAHVGFAPCVLRYGEKLYMEGQLSKGKKLLEAGLRLFNQEYRYKGYDKLKRAQIESFLKR